MNLHPNELPQQLEQQLLPIYLISGDELLLAQEAGDIVRAHCKTAGCEHQLLYAGRHFEWGDFDNAAGNLGLFASRRLIELRFEKKPDIAATSRIQRWAQSPPEGDVLLVLCPKLERGTTRHAWYKATDRVGAVLRLWPLKPGEMKRWLQRRMRAAELRLSDDAVQLLLDRTEGNLAAAQQAVEQLHLIDSGGQLEAETVERAIADNAQADIFQLADAALDGDAKRCLTLMARLRATRTEPQRLLWVLGRELETLSAIQDDKAALKRVWERRQPLVQRCLKRLPPARLSRLLRRAHRVDCAIQGDHSISPWDELGRLIVEFCGLSTRA